MKKFDPIDIFFIALISTYFITLICFLLALIYVKISSLIKRLHEKANLEEKITPTTDSPSKLVESEPVKEKNIKSEKLKIKVKIKLPHPKTESKLAKYAIIRKLFMKEKEVIATDTSFKMDPIIINIEPKKEEKVNKPTKKPKTKRLKKTNSIKKQNNNKQKSSKKKNNTAKDRKQPPKNAKKTQNNKPKSNNKNTKKRA